jgi:hypothetical protein
MNAYIVMALLVLLAVVMTAPVIISDWRRRSRKQP